jgi:hypothetical protein
MERRRRDDEVRLRESVADLAAIFDQKAPFEHDVLGDREHALLEHGPHLVRKPRVEFGATVGIGDQFNAKTDFGKGHRTHMEPFKRLPRDESKDFLLWLGSRSSERMLVSRSQPVTRRPRALALVSAWVRFRYRGTEKPASRRSTLRRSGHP